MERMGLGVELGVFNLEIEKSECFLLIVALREYLTGLRRSIMNEGQLIDHPASKVVIETILKRLEQLDNYQSTKV
jgi:hypothetical protein